MRKKCFFNYINFLNIFAGNEEFPTLLHFAAKYGLEKLACQLLETAGGEQACHIRNSYHLTPTEIAERANHVRLANTLKGHMVRNKNFDYVSSPVAAHNS